MICKSPLTDEYPDKNLTKKRPNTLNLSSINYKHNVLYKTLHTDQLNKYEQNIIGNDDATENMQLQVCEATPTLEESWSFLAKNDQFVSICV